MKTINKIKKELHCQIKKYSFFNNIRYIETDLGNFVIKKEFDESFFHTLARNGFKNYIPSKYHIDHYNLYPYVDSYPIEDGEKGQDLIFLMSSLHNKTSFSKEMTTDQIKEFYENKKKIIADMTSYYNNLRFFIEDKKLPTPSEVFFLKNMSIIFISLNHCSKFLEDWYQKVQDKKRIRVSTIHNNLSLEHLIENDQPYLISWDHSKIDMPIYDFIKFYRRDFHKLDFRTLLSIYENNINIKEDEKLLLYFELLLPNKIIFTESEMKNIYDLTYQDLYLTKTNLLLSQEDKIKHA